ncbi:hypothetical protein J6590_025981 [Homalodisca vitripennis]|nr:hypothetical protein J6590_025981 [Homalodisca vitripennis]
MIMVETDGLSCSIDRKSGMKMSQSAQGRARRRGYQCLVPVVQCVDHDWNNEQACRRRVVPCLINIFVLEVFTVLN